MGYFKQNIAIDLGTATVLVCVDGKGVVIKAPSIVAVKEGTNEAILNSLPYKHQRQGSDKIGNASRNEKRQNEV